MRKLLETIGTVFIIASVIFLFVHSFIVTGSPGEDFARDLLGLPIPTPPVWTSVIPVFGVALNFIFQFFSLHGLVGILIACALFSIGGFFINLGEKSKSETPKEVSHE